MAPPWILFIIAGRIQFNWSQRLIWKLTRFDLDKASVIEKAAKVSDDFGTCFEYFAGRVVHHEVKVALTVSLLLVLEAVMLRRKLVKAWSEQHNISRKHAELTHIMRSGIRSTGETNNTNPIMFIVFSNGHVSVLGRVLLTSLLAGTSCDSPQR